MNKQTASCPIWGTPATEKPCGKDGRAVDSPRAGGKYFISGTAVSMLESLDASSKALLTTWLIEQRRLGVKCPEAASTTVKEAKQRRPLPVHKRPDRLLAHLANYEKHPGSGFRDLCHKRNPDSFLLALAHVESSAEPSSIGAGGEELNSYLEYLQQKEWIVFEDRPDIGSGGHVTVNGYIRLEELTKAAST